LKFKKIILPLLIFLLINSFLYSENPEQNKNVLILFSMSPSTPAYRVITDGMRAELTKAFGDAISLHMEYLESERYAKGEYPEDRFERFNQKYDNVRLDLLICVGVDILDPVKKYGSRQILDLPAVVLDFDFSDYGIRMDLQLNDHTTVIGMKLDIVESLKTALGLFPGTNSVYFISGTSVTDQLYLNATRACSGQFDKSKQYTYITDCSMDEVLSRVRHLPDSSIIFVSGFNVDSRGVHYYNPESVRLISQAANVPVFAYSDMGFGEGAVGGYVLSFKKIGLLVGGTAVKILNGADPASISISEDDTHEYILDWRQLKRWNLLGSELIPKGSKIQFMETSFFEKYRLIISAGVLFLILQTLLIIYLIRSNRQQRLITKRLVEAENKFRELDREDRVMMLGQLTASLSHELNQPLTAILSTAQAGLRFIDSKNTDPELLKELFGNIVEDDKRTAAILSSIRGMMKLEKREKERVNLNSLIDELVNIYRSEAIEKGIKLEVTLADHPVFIMADRIQVQQVLLNLIANATQSIEKINAKDRRILVTETEANGQVVVSVRDFGEGIEESLKDRLFKPFVTSKKEGTGIGLSISRSIINDHGGKIWAENLPEGGAIFAFSLKIC
jgi:signal transduction histidine kinase